MVAHRRGKDLKDLIVRGDPYNIRTDLFGNSRGGYIKCNKKCESCDYFLIPTDKVMSFASSKTYNVKRVLPCSSKYIVYLAFCSVCREQGVGSTFDWKPRMRNYKSHISNC